MLIKYKVWDEDSKMMVKELATFSDMTYDYKEGLCIISFFGDSVDDILIRVGSIKYNEILDNICNSAIRGLGAVDLSEFNTIYEDWEYADELSEEHFRQVHELFDSL